MLYTISVGGDCGIGRYYMIDPDRSRFQVSYQIAMILEIFHYPCYEWAAHNFSRT
jgi:hypothetical protein